MFNKKLQSKIKKAKTEVFNVDLENNCDNSLDFDIEITELKTEEILIDDSDVEEIECSPNTLEKSITHVLEIVSAPWTSKKIKKDKEKVTKVKEKTAKEKRKTAVYKVCHMCMFFQKVVYYFYICKMHLYT